MKPIKVIGAGLSGLIMAEVLSAQGFDYYIIEKKSEEDYKPAEHVYYYHTDSIRKLLPIPLKKIRVNKLFLESDRLPINGDHFSSHIRNPNLFDLINYTRKFNEGGLITNSSLEDCGKEMDGWIVDYDLSLHQILFNRHRFKIKFDTVHTSLTDEIIVSTAPLTIFKSLVDLSLFKMSFDELMICKIENVNFDKVFIIHNDGKLFKRVVLIKDTMYIEGKNPNISLSNLRDILNFKDHKMSCDKQLKVPAFNKIDNIARKNLIGQLSIKYSIYSLGRFATWSYKRTDHVVDDALDIVKMIRFTQQGRW